LVYNIRKTIFLAPRWGENLTGCFGEGYNVFIYLTWRKMLVY